MILVLGLAIWGLEVARSMLDPHSPTGAAARRDHEKHQNALEAESGFVRATALKPSNFLEGDAARRAEEERRAAVAAVAAARDEPPPLLDALAVERLNRGGLVGR